MSNATSIIKAEYPLDPLENTDNFNIIQFLRDTDSYDTPEDHSSLISPTSSTGSMQLQHQPQQHMQQQQQPLMQQQQQQQRSNMYHQNRRLPESPPMTEICGNASSSSSSSHHSDPMFSPNEFNGYSTGGNNNGGMILGVQDLQNNHLVQSQQQQQGSQNFWQQQQQQQNASPPVEQKVYGMENLYNMLQSNDDDQQSHHNHPASRKRSRMDAAPCETPKLVLGSSQNNMEFGGGDENYNHMQAIKFAKFQEEQWNSLYDQNGRELQQLSVHVVADKGFNYSTIDNCFVNQKKNHFQVSVHVEASDSMPPKFVVFNGSLVPIRDFKLAFCGAKAEMPTSEVCIRQSRADRKPHPHTPVLFEIQERRMTKVTVPRLHFSETTLNNQRKNFRPNPEQKYFLLVVRLFASISDDVSILIQSYSSDKVIVRATNPGSFEPPDSDVAWQRHNNTLYTQGPVSIGTDRQAGKLNVDGDIYLTGRIINPSDIRLKEGIIDKDASEALQKLLQLRVVDYAYKPEVAEKWGLSEEQRKRTGLIAQELAAVFPEAVRDIGDYFTIDESRVFYETVLATQQLFRLTGDLDSKIDEKVDDISRRLTEYARRKKLANSMASNLNGGADAKSLSYSRSSLASTATIRKSSSRHRSRHSDDYGYDAGLCSSKFTQGTIVTLIGVMAVCLMAMSALYVLDWHNRNYGYHHHHQPYVPSQKGEPANMVVSPLHYMPTYQPDAPPLQGHCFSPSCRTYCCGDKPPTLPAADGTAAAAAAAGSAVDVEYPGNRTTGIGRAPYFKQRAFETGVQILIPLMNITLDQRYCVEKSCNTRRGIFNLFVPVSKFVPDEPIEIQIIVPKFKTINNCGHLPDFDHKKCPASRYSSQMHKDLPTSTQIFENTFELSVGSYIRSAYRFRVGLTTESCSTIEESYSGGFEEYNLIFYRMCSSQNATTIPTTPATLTV